MSLMASFLPQSHSSVSTYNIGPELPRLAVCNGGSADSANDLGASIEVEGGFLFKTPMENLVIKTFQFPVG